MSVKIERRVSESKQELKLVIVGESSVGKSCLILSYSMHSFEEDHIPTVVETYKTRIKVDDKEITLYIWDTAGHEEYTKLRLLSYPRTDVFIICYSIIDPKTFDLIPDKWYSEVHRNVPEARCILVGTKKDLVNDQNVLRKLADQNLVPVDTNEAIKLQKKIGAFGLIGINN